MSFVKNRMNISGHQTKIKDIETSLHKLDPEQDYEAVIELAMLIAAHYLNAMFHRVGILPVNKDIRHNRLATFLKENSIFEERVRTAIEGIEMLRPGQVYGKGQDTMSGKRALAHLEIIRKESEGRA